MYDSRLGRWLTLDEVKRFPSRYIGMGNNPALYADKNGKDIIIFLNSNAVYGKGHTALAITNNKGGWTFISKAGRANGANAKNPFIDRILGILSGGAADLSGGVSKDYDSYSQLIDDISKGYDKAFRLKTFDQNLDQKTINIAIKDAKNKYRVWDNNCAETCIKALKSQNFLAYPSIIPKIFFYKSFEANYNMFKVFQTNDQIKMINLKNPVIEIGNLEMIQFGDKIIEP